MRTLFLFFRRGDLQVAGNEIHHEEQAAEALEDQNEIPVVATGPAHRDPGTICLKTALHIVKTILI